MKQIRMLTQIDCNMKQLQSAKLSFEQDHPEVRIEVGQCTDYFEMMQAFNSDTTPDILETGGFQASNPDGIFRDLNPYLAENPDLEADIFPGLLKVTRHNGILPGLPVEISPPLILYDKEKFDRAGLSYPAEPWTWQDLVELAERLTLRGGNGKTTQYGFKLGVDIEWFEPFIMRNGGRYIAPDGSTARGFVDAPRTIEALQLLINAYRERKIMPKPGQPEGDKPVESAMKFCFIWDVPQDNADRYGIVGLPSMPGGFQSNMIYMGGVGITTKSSEPRLAWAFIRHYLFDCHSWMPPVSRSQAEQRGLTRHPIWSRYLAELEHVQLNGYYLNKKWNASRQLINENIYKMILEDADVAQTVRSWTRYA